MFAFQWDSCFITGIREIDEQHHRLLDLINRFGELVTSREETSAENLEEIFSELADYARYHFAEEESLMDKSRVDRRHIAEHKASHHEFLVEVTQLHRSVSTSNQNAADYLLRFLMHWLAYHILGSDQVMARQMGAIQSGVSPEDAYQSHVWSKDPSTDTLLTALNGLFHQVSERNRELVQLNKSLEARVAKRTQELTEANQRLDDLANTDTLTGLPNRRYAMQSLADEWKVSSNNQSPLACMMIDADGFKQINDTYGHDAGDAVLNALARRLQNAVRTDDIVCRLGGDEFLIICPNTPLEGAIKVAESVRKEVATLRVPAGTGQWIGSISVGVAARSEPMAGFEGLIKAADDGVYIAKRNGRNCVGAAQQTRN